MRNFKDLWTRNLFETESYLKIIRITRDDVLFQSDNFRLFSDQVIKHEVLYPDIERWLKTKVCPGIRDDSRIAYLGLDNNEPVVSAILKKSDYAKICHLHIEKKIRDQHVGELFFSMMALDVRNRSKEIHFTLPEDLWLNKKEFFSSFGFFDSSKAQNQYRRDENELHCSAPFEVVWGNVLCKLPKIVTSLTKTADSIFSGILMSIKPEHVEKIGSGEKVVEIRKKFDTKWIGCRMTVYSSRPDQAIYGYAKIQDVKRDTPEKIWSQYWQDIGVKKNVFDEYVGSCDQVYAILLKDFEPYYNPISVLHIGALLKNENLKPPQSYLSLTENKGWSKAISVAELLHNRFWICQTAV